MPCRQVVTAERHLTGDQDPFSRHRSCRTQPGTEGSNPSPSSGESIANHFLGSFSDRLAFGAVLDFMAIFGAPLEDPAAAHHAVAAAQEILVEIDRRALPTVPGRCELASGCT